MFLYFTNETHRYIIGGKYNFVISGLAYSVRKAKHHGYNQEISSRHGKGVDMVYDKKDLKILIVEDDQAIFRKKKIWEDI